MLEPFVPEEVVGALLDALALQSWAVRLAREESRRAIEHLLGLLGYSGDLAASLEEQSFRAGNVWRFSS